MHKLFTREISNRGRQVELDIARGLSVVFMVLIHTQQHFAAEATQQGLAGSAIDFLGGMPSAPVFMFLLGVGVVYSSKSRPELFIRRGLKLIAGAYVLNLLRGVIPALIQYATYGRVEYLDWARDEFIAVDILQFAGLAMLMFGVIKRLELDRLRLVLLGLACASLNYLLSGCASRSVFVSAVSGLVWGSSQHSYFPFLT